MDRNVTVRFYEIRSTGDGRLNVEQVLDAIHALPLAERLGGAGGHTVLRLEELYHLDGTRIGDFTRVQTENLPSHPADDASHPLPVDRLGHHAAFRYDPATRIMALQFDLQNSIGKVCHYLSRFSGGYNFSYYPVLRQDALASFEAETPTKLKVRVARVSQFQNLGLDETDFEDALRRMGALFDAPTIEISISARGRNGGMNKESTLQTVRRLLGFRDAGIPIQAITAETEEAHDPYNFITQLLKYSSVLELPHNDPVANREARLAYVRECFDGQREYFRAAYAAIPEA